MDIDALVKLLDPHATAIADGGDRARAARRPIEGAEQIVRYLVGIDHRIANVTLLERTVNGQPGLVARQDGHTVSVIAFELSGEKIKHLWAVRNPDKLWPWTTGETPSD